MSVLIKGMQMPDNCDVCIFSDWSNLHQTSCCKLKEYKPGFQDYSIAYRTQRSNICPLVELPEHHGRLIDADEMKNLWTGCSINGSISPLLDVRPTVVEAE